MQKLGRNRELRAFLDETVGKLRIIVTWLEPFMPTTATKLTELLAAEKPLKRGALLFPRLKP
jgi:methionyl-tRNA synthetase